MADDTLSATVRPRNARMSREIILAIFEAASKGEEQKVVAARYGVAKQTVSDIFLGRRNSRITGASLAAARRGFADFAAMSVAERVLYWSIPEPNCGCWLWLGGLVPSEGGRAPRGYMRVVDSDGSTHVRAASRCSYEAFVGPIPSGMSVCHRCDFPPCVNPEHLFLGTQQDNVTDMIEKGREAWGERSGTAKLTSSLVRAIRERVAAGAMQKTVAAEFDISAATVSAIILGKRWSRLP